MFRHTSYNFRPTEPIFNQFSYFIRSFCNEVKIREGCRVMFRSRAYEHRKELVCNCCESQCITIFHFINSIGALLFAQPPSMVDVTNRFNQVIHIKRIPNYQTEPQASKWAVIQRSASLGKGEKLEKKL